MTISFTPNTEFFLCFCFYFLLDSSGSSCIEALLNSNGFRFIFFWLLDVFVLYFLVTCIPTIVWMGQHDFQILNHFRYRKPSIYKAIIERGPNTFCSVHDVVVYYCCYFHKSDWRIDILLTYKIHPFNLHQFSAGENQFDESRNF